MENMEHTPHMSWAKFAGMIATSTIVMFFLMYQLVYDADHLYFSLNRFLAALIMGGVMTAIMLAFMGKMYHPPLARLAVLWGGIALAVILLALNRTQALVGDTEFMKAMIPHHSIAINNARKARITDPRVRRLADGIIASQVREIEEMKILTADRERLGSRGQAALPARSTAITPEMSRQIADAVQ